MNAPQPVTPRPAGTIVLVRRGSADAVEVLLIQRPLTMKFLPGCWAFPGGSVDPADGSAPALARLCAAPADPAQRGRLAAVVAAVRELFEEAGVLLATRRDGSLPPGDHSEFRRRLRQDAAAFPAFLAEHDLWIGDANLRYLHRWTTPPQVAHRFDTRFFVAALPVGSRETLHAGEVAAADWLTPQAALQQWREGRRPAVTATVDSLEKIAAFPTLHALMQHLPPASAVAADQHWLDPGMMNERPTFGPEFGAD